MLKLLIAVDELNIHPLISHIQEYLIEHQTEFLQQNPTVILETVYQHETFTDLWNFCFEKICEEPKILLNSDKFINLKAPLLELLLKRDDLYLNEIEIWESLLKWCFSQQNVVNDPIKWNKEDITKLERVLFRFIYCGNIELKNLQGPDVLKLLIAVDELNIQQLVSHIQEYLIEHQTEFLHQNPTGILEIVYQHETFTDLWNFYLEKVCQEPKILFDSGEFIHLKASLLELLLKRDDLNMDEIEIWDSLLKWCFSQQNVMNDPTKWSKDDITKIERALHRFIPLIRFYDIEPTDFFYKVYCYKDILSFGISYSS